MRITWVDNAKALGIITIVLGHGPGLNEFVQSFFYAFHVPLFFFLSGVLIQSRHLDVPFRDFVSRNARRLVVPYFFFWFASLLLWVLFRVIEGELLLAQEGGLLDQVKGVLMGTGEALLGVNGVLWFYTALFVSGLALYFAARLTALKFILLLGVCFVVGAFIRPVLAGQHFPWNIELIPVVMLFLGSGYLLSRQALMPDLSDKVWAFIAVVSATITVGIVLVNGKADFSWQVWGYSYAKYIVGAFSGVLMTVAISQLLKPTRIARYLSDNTMTIFSIHFPMFTAFYLVGIHVLGLPADFEQHSSAVAFVYTVLAFLLCIPSVILLRRYFPWVLGARRRTQS